MPRKHVVKQLNDEQFEFVINGIIDGWTDREISIGFQKLFNQPLAKSSLNRWRTAAGNELAERYRLARYQAKQLLEDIGTETDANAYQIIIQSIEDRLLTATREVISQNPVKLLQIKQEENRRKLKEQELELKKQQLELEREKFRGSQIDRVQLGVEFTSDLLEYLADKDGLTFFKKHAKPFNEFLKQKYAPQES